MKNETYIDLDKAREERARSHDGNGVGRDDSNQAGKDIPKSRATKLVEIALSRYDFGVSTLDETYAIRKQQPQTLALLRGNKTSLRGQLAREYFRQYEEVASQSALTDALLVIEGMAQEKDAQELHIRVASVGTDLWLDMGGQDGRAIQITPADWSIKDQPPMLFKRTALMHPLPEPERGGSIDELWQFLNVDDDDKPLVIAWQIATLFQNIPHPVLSLFGEQGTGKTTAHKMLVTMIDPGPVPTRKPPRDPETWVTAAQGSWIVGLDNLSKIQDWLSDSICRAVTGDGDVRRRLFTDGEHAVFAFRRCVCLNGIDLGAIRGDLSERMLPITLGTISEAKRRSEDAIWKSWAKTQPRILAAVLDIAVQVLAMLPEMTLASTPRMADFAKILATVDVVLDTSGLQHYQEKLKKLAADSLTGDAFILAVSGMRESFNGTSAELLDKLTPERPSRDWPKNARAVTALLTRHAPALRKSAWHVHNDGGHNRNKVQIWTLTPPEEKARISSPQPPQPPQNDGYAGVAGHEYSTSPLDPCPHCDGEGCGYCESS